jgi:hypothetical protein
MKDIEKALLVQHHQLDHIEQKAVELKNEIDRAKKQEQQMKNNTDELLLELKELTEMLDNIDDQSLNHIFKELDQLPQQMEQKNTNNKLKVLNIKAVEVGNWKEFIKNIDEYIITYQLDLEKDPITQMLSQDQMIQISKDFDNQFGRVKWDKFDYIFVTVTALVAFVLDVFIVKMPAFESRYPNKSPDKLTFFDVPEEEQSSLGKWINSVINQYLSSDNNELIKQLEKTAKTSYDAVGEAKKFSALFGSPDSIRLNGINHRVMTPGHDPILQFIFGVLDVFKGSMTVFGNDGKINVLDNPNYSPVSIIEALMKTVSHFITDIGTKQGVPAPLFTLTQAITLDTPILFKVIEGGKQTIRPMKLNELARRMYTNGGYNFNHFIVMGIVPTTVELMIRIYSYFRGYLEGIPSKKNQKLHSLLTMSHTLAMSGNIVKMGINQWNPLAFNYAELLALSKSVFSFFRASLLRDKDIQKHLMDNWKKIYQNM